MFLFVKGGQKLDAAHPIRYLPIGLKLTDPVAPTKMKTILIREGDLLLPVLSIWPPKEAQGQLRPYSSPMPQMTRELTHRHHYLTPTGFLDWRLFHRLQQFPLR